MDYEKEYKKLKAGISKAYLYAQTDSTKAVLESILPELKSEDEKIRKALIRFHKSTIDIDGIKGNEIVAWLEKQAEQPKEATYIHEAETGNGNIKALVTEKVLLPKFKPGEWSEKDEKMLNDIISDVKFEGYNNDMQANSYRKINWLNSLKDNINFNYHKDDKILDKITRIVSNYWNSIPDSDYDENIEVESCYNWLKSLK